MLMIQAAAIMLIALILTPGLLFYFDVTPKLVVLLLASGVALVPMRRSTGHWLKSCASNRGAKRRNAKPPWRPAWMAANILKSRARYRS